MESRYYLFPDQTLENTKISDRVHALHITAPEWNKIRKHLDRKKDIQELMDKEESKRRYLEEGNKVMTEKWEDSIEKIRKHKDEARAKTTEEIQEEKMQKYYVMREEQEKLRKEYIDKVKQKMFRTSGVCNDLNSAFVTSETLYERQKQREFAGFLQEHEREIDEKFAKKYREDAVKEVEEKKAAAHKIFEKNKQYGAYLQHVIQEKEEKEKTAKENEIKNESEDNIKAVEEMERMKQVEEEEKAKRRKEIGVEMEKYMKSRVELQKQLKQEEKEIDEVVEIYRETKHTIDCLRKEKEKEIQNDIIKRREVVSSLVGAVQKSKDEAENRQIQAAIAEKNAIEEAKIKARAEYDQKMKNERLEDRQVYLKRKEADQKRTAEIRKWEIINRYKVDEATKAYEEEKKKQLWNNILKFRRDLLDQMDDHEEEKKRQEEFECWELTNIKEQDKLFFEYADEILKEAKKKGRSTYPIEKAIMDYKKNNNILPNGVKCNNTGKKTKESASIEIINKSIKGRPCRCNIRKK